MLFFSIFSSGVTISKGISRKAEMYNILIDDYFKKRGLDFPRAVSTTEGAYFVQIISDALWYITNQHQVINDAARTRKGVQPVPAAFAEYTGFNDVKRKKEKSQMKSPALKSNGEALYSLLLKPIINSTPAWKTAGTDIQNLADCLIAYSKYLEVQLETQCANLALDHPVRTIAEDTTLDHRRAGITIKTKYSLLDSAVKTADHMPVFFDESTHLEVPFESATQRFRYFEELQLTVPVDILRFCPGGSCTTTVCVVQVKADRSEPEVLTQGARLLQKIRPSLHEFHTRMQKETFKKKIGHITKVSPAVRDCIYRALTQDASAPANAVMTERLRLISLGQTGIVDDLRRMNTGRPHVFDQFFDKLQEVVESVVAADERRHNVAHLSEWLSLKEMIAKAAEVCPPGTKIPSASLVRLQFAPRNPYVHTALNFTSRIQVQYKIQRRQLRVGHPDDHYCAAQLQYFKEKAVELRDEASVFCCDDKAKIPLGEPDCPVSTGVRGKKTLAPVTTTLGACDHDMTMASLVPSVILATEIPESSQKSFVRGTVTTVVSDAVFKGSNPFRHAATLVKLAAKDDKKIIMKFTDGGTDHRNNLASVKCANICVFKELDLDMLVHARCAPWHSWTNPAERIMSILNLGLQNCSLSREMGDEQAEASFRKCGSMSQLRAHAEKNPEIKMAWRMSVEPAQSIVRNRFARLSLKSQPIQVMDPVSDEEIDIVKRHLRELFPDMNLSKLQKVHTSKVKSYTAWVEQHCRERHYTFQIKKCGDPNCCIPPRASNLSWLPDPVLDESGEHYLKYKEVMSRNNDTTEADRPSLKPVKEKPQRKRTSQALENQAETGDSQQMDTSDPSQDAETPVCRVSLQTPENIPSTSDLHDTSLYTAQNARATVYCTECRKPRVIYSKQRLSQRHKLTLTLVMSEYDYTCGAPLLPPTCSISKTVMCRTGISCGCPVENPYYTSAIGRLDICAFCAAEEAEVNAEMKKKFKTVLPLCADCCEEGRKAIVYRPFGNRK
ncbi:PREDICTED: uncharacterized protein LOC106816458 [Priapulus caudatus]|uniref:Uncharacterized protein LOC106816458 n=1 Tax=Priapulus caudatus TaxID=37621 RepID=A0ABM1EWJ6_PRICU|nr:PREDICTED: uncharacterized protein LOC106816458 [Priapulus caudatus]